MQSNNLAIPAILNIDYNKIDSSHTIDYLNKNGIHTADDLEAIRPICYLEGNSEDFHLHSKTYELNHSLEDTWHAYLNIPPKKSWSGKLLMFSFVYNSDHKSLSYLNDKYEGMKDRQLIFIVIKLLFGMFKLAVTHYVSEVSEKDKKVKLCYVEGGKSSGSQLISFKKISENKTAVLHETYYKSDSKFRDKILYPFIHGIIINQFHNNVKKYLVS